MSLSITLQSDAKSTKLRTSIKKTKKKITSTHLGKQHIKITPDIATETLKLRKALSSTSSSK